MILPTIAVHHPLDHGVMMVINAAEFDEATHDLWVDPVPTTGDLRVAKGARGLWFVKRDGEAVTVGFKSEAEAQAALTDLQG